VIGSRATFPCAGGSRRGVTSALLSLTGVAAIGPKPLPLVEHGSSVPLMRAGGTGEPCVNGLPRSFQWLEVANHRRYCTRRDAPQRGACV
jgi:hypothetical protein